MLHSHTDWPVLILFGTAQGASGRGGGEDDAFDFRGLDPSRGGSDEAGLYLSSTGRPQRRGRPRAGPAGRTLVRGGAAVAEVLQAFVCMCLCCWAAGRAGLACHIMPRRDGCTQSVRPACGCVHCSPTPHITLCCLLACTAAHLPCNPSLLPTLVTPGSVLTLYHCFFFSRCSHSFHSFSPHSRRWVTLTWTLTGAAGALSRRATRALTSTGTRGASGGRTPCGENDEYRLILTVL